MIIKVSHSSQLVGQINRNEKSELYTFPLNDDVGKDFKTVVDRVRQVYSETKLVTVVTMLEVLKLWTIHSYEGDYNPLQRYGYQTDGLSMIFYLKYKCIEEKPVINTITYCR